MPITPGQRFVRRHNAARTGTANATAADITYDTAVLSEGGYSYSAPEVTVDEAGLYLNIFDLGQCDHTSTRGCGTLVPAINGTQQERFRATHRYLRNSGGTEGASIGMAILDLAVNDAVKTRNPGILTPTDAAINYATRASFGGGLQLIRLPDGNLTHVERTVDAAEVGASNINTTRPWLDSSGTWTTITFNSEVRDDDGLYSGAGGDITLAANTKYLIAWGATIYSTDASRHTNVTRLEINGNNVQSGSGYQRNTASQGPPMSGMYLHETGGSTEIVRLQATHETEGGDAGTPQVSDAYLQVLELPSSAEWIHVDNGATDSLATALAGTTTWYDTPLSSTLRADGNSDLSLDAANDAVQNDSGAALPVLAIGWHRWDRDSGASGTRKMPWTRWDNGGASIGYGIGGAYSRGQQGSDDNFQAHYCSVATMDLADGADLSLQVNEPASGSNADMGIYASTSRYFLGVQVLNLESLDAGGGAAQNIIPSAIASDEAHGSPTVVPSAVSVSPGSISSEEAFGGHSVNTGAVSVSPGAISSEEAFGSHSVDVAAATISVPGIGTLEAFGSHILSVSGVSVLPSSIASLEFFGAPTIVPGARLIGPNGITSAEDFGDASVVPLAVLITPNGVASLEQFGAPQVQRELIILPASIASLEAFGNGVINPGLVAILPAGIASAEIFGTHNVTIGVVTISPAGIATIEAFGVANLSVGPTSINPGGIASLEVFGSHVINLGATIIAPAGAVTGEAFGNPSILIGTADIFPASIASLEAFGNHAITVGATLIGAIAINSGEAFGTHLLGTGQVVVSPSSILTGELFGSGIVSSGQIIVQPAAIASDEAFGVPSLTVGDVVLIVSSIDSLEAFGTPELNNTFLVLPGGVASQEIFGNALLQAGATVISPNAIPGGELFGNAIASSGGAFILPASVASEEIFGNATLFAGETVIIPVGVGSSEAFGLPKVGDNSIGFAYTADISTDICTDIVTEIIYG